MIPQTIAAILLFIPLVAMVVLGIGYWSEFRKDQRNGKPIRKTDYKKPYLYLLATGVLCMWVSWIGSIVLLFLNRFYSIFGFLTFSTHSALPMQIAGFVVFYVGATTYNLNLVVAGKYLRPSTSGICGNHKLIQEGPFGVVRHPLYISYILILVGLSLILFNYWLLIPTLCVLIGIYPTAKAEEAALVERFGEEYIEYQRSVGMFFPRLF